MIKKQKHNKIDKVISKRKSITASGKGKAVTWTRVSSEEQLKSNNSIETQITACHKYCELHNKEVKFDFGGTFESAKKAGDKFLEMVGAVLNDPEVDTIVVYDYDRFSRNMEEGLTYKSQLNKSGVTIIAVNQPVDKNNLLAEHIEAILLIVADIDNAMRRHKCYEGMVACINRGEWYSRPPLGYTSKKVNREHQVTINDDGKILKHAWEWIAIEPNISQQTVLSRLQARGLNISKQRLSICLRNSFYCGRLEHKFLNGKIIKGKQEQLISEALFDKVQRILNKNNSNYEQSEETPRFPLKGHVYYNGHVMTGYTVKKKNIDYYKYSGKDGAVNVSAKELHSKYIELLDKFNIPSELIPVLVEVLKMKFKEKENNQFDDITAIEKNLSTIRTHIKTVKRRFAIGKIDEDTYASALKDLEADEREAEIALEKESVNLSNLASYIEETIQIACKLSSYWSSKDFEVCQKIQKMVFPNGVKWNKETREIRTIETNKFLDIIYNISRTYINDTTQKKDKPCDLSFVVAEAGLEPTTSGL